MRTSRVADRHAARFSGPLLAMVLCSAVLTGPAGADEPEVIRPTALTAPLPLTADQTSPVAPRRPLPDWKLLAAIGAAFAVLAVVRFATGRRPLATLPPDVFEVLGTAPVAAGHTARIVRFGSKTLLVSVSSGGCHTLAELTDPQATEAIAAACRTAQARRGRVAVAVPGREAR